MVKAGWPERTHRLLFSGLYRQQHLALAIFSYLEPGSGFESVDRDDGRNGKQEIAVRAERLVEVDL